MANDHQTVGTVIVPPPVRFPIGRFDRHANARRRAIEPSHWIDSRVYRRPLVGHTASDEVVPHRLAQQRLGLIEQIRIGKHIDHLAKSGRQVARVTLGTCTPDRSERTRFMIPAHEVNAPTFASASNDLFDHQVRPRSLRQQIAEQHDARRLIAPRESTEQRSQFRTASVHISHDNRVAHGSTILPKMPIRILPADIVQQIAAGEVVERPASIVKELLENALDAGATRLTVRIRGGGRESVEVVDDGCGIDPSELPLAVAAHATSKIAATSDLNALRTFGFRGEALAAIAGVSHLRIRSRRREAADAALLESRFGHLEPVRPAAGAVGTSVEVLGLFGNVPARRKFLKSDPAEAARVTEVVTNAALAHPSVGFTLESAGREVFALEPMADLFARAVAIFPDVLGSDPLPIAGEAEFDGISARVVGLACRPERLRSVSRTQRIFVNGRPITDRSLQHAVREAYRGRAAPNLQPTFVLFIEIDPPGVDVNVHPQKTEVRWRNAAQLHRLVHHAVADGLEQHVGTTQGGTLLEASRAHMDGVPSQVADMPMAPRVPGDPVFATMRERVTEWSPRAASTTMDSSHTEQLLQAPARSVDVLLVDETWIVHASVDGIIITDQHALHERVMFSDLRRRITAGNMMQQRFLVPVSVAVPPEAIATLESLTPLLQRLGIEANPAGPRSIAVHAFPVFLLERRVDAAAFMAHILADEALSRGVESGQIGHAQEAALADVLDMMACKAAVKAGDRLSREEAARLIADGAITDRGTHCPHGRPTSVHIPLADIERRFGRR